MYKISILVPVFNEGKEILENIEKIIKFMENYEKNYEIVRIDDGSTDGTYDSVMQLSKRNRKIKVVKHRVNMGIGAALRTGLKEANGEFIAALDSDMTYDIADIRNMIEKLKMESADIVIGTPYLRSRDNKEMPFVRFVFSRMGNFFDQIIFGLNFTTPTCFFRVYKNNVAKKLYPEIKFERFEGIPESSIKAYRMGFKIIEFPSYYNMKRITVSAKIDLIKSLKRTLKHLKMLWQLLNYRPITY